MTEPEDEEPLLRSVALQNAKAIQLARQQAEQALELKTAELARAQELLRHESERLRITLSSIGDAVITTDAKGVVTFLNGVAEKLTGWAHRDALGRPLAEVFNIVNQDSRLPVENPAVRALHEGRIGGLANDTLLNARDGVQRGQ